MLRRHHLAGLLVTILVGCAIAAPRPKARMVMKIRPMGRALDRPVPGPLNYAHVPLDDPEVATMANFAATSLSFANIKSEEPLDLVRITSASRRTDSDINSDYKLTMVLNGQGQFYYCNAAVSERVTSITQESSHREVHLTQPSSCLQGPQELILAEDDAGTLPAALFAASELSKSVLVLHTSPTLRNVTQWQSTEKYFGNEYKLSLLFANSDNGQLRCLAEVIERISHNDTQVMRVDCSPAAAAEALGDVDQEPEVEGMASFVTMFLKESRNLDLNLLRVTSALKTPFEGVNIRPSVTLSTKSATDDDEVFYFCNAAVFQDLKSHDYELIRSQTTCSNSAPAKREIDAAPPVDVKPVGAYEDVPVDDEQVKHMATFATHALPSSMNAGSTTMTLRKIGNAQRQVVAGTNTRLVLDLTSSTGEHLHCMVVVFDQPWTNTRELSEAMCRPGTVDETSDENIDDE